MTIKEDILKHLKTNSCSRKELPSIFPNTDPRIINNILTSLIMSGKLLCKKGQFSLAAKKSKMGNVRVEIEGIWFDSKKEGARYSVLKMLERTGKIKDLKLQVPFVVIDTIMWRDKKLSAIKYIVDFTYIDQDGILTAEDVKGRVLDVYRLKRQLFIPRYPEYRFIET